MNGEMRQLTLAPLDDRTWRLSDDRLPLHDDERLLGCVERADDGFDVVWLVGGFAMQHLATLPEVLLACVERARVGDS